MWRWMIVLAGLSVMAASQADEWERRSPDGAVAFAMSRAGSRMLLGTSDGLHASSDEGASWTRIGSIPPYQGVYRIAVDPRDANHWYLGVVESYIEGGSGYRPVLTRNLVRETRDGGASWQEPTFYTGNGYGLPVFHPAADRVLMTYSGYLSWQYSANGGLTWSTHSGISPDYVVGLALPGHPFAALSVSEQDFTTMTFHLGSADGGSFSAPVATLNISGTWAFHALMPRNSASQAFWIAAANLRPTYVGSVDFVSGQLVQFPPYDGRARQVFDDPASPGTVLLLTAEEEDNYEHKRFGVSTLVPGATQWSLRGGFEHSLKGVHRIGADPKLLLDGSALWLTDTSVGARRSVDGGATWQVRNSGLKAAAVNAVLLDPRDPDRLLAGRDMQSLQRSVDAGLHWADVGGSVPNDVRRLARSPVDPDHVLATARGGLYRSRDAGQTWQLVPTAIDPAASEPGWHEITWCANTDTHLLATVGRKLYRSVDGGLTWDFVLMNFYGTSFALHTATRAPHNVYVRGLVDNNVGTLRTDDCGTSFATVATNDASSGAIAVSPYDSRVVAMAVRPPGNYAEDRVALSSDAGANWTLTDVPAWEPVGMSDALGWFRGCGTQVFTTAALLTARGVQLAPLPELPRQTTYLTQVRAADSHCIDGSSVEVIGMHDGVWLHRIESRIFADGYETP